MESRPVRLLRITTVPVSLKVLLKGQLSWMQRRGFEVLAVSSDGPEVSYLQGQGVRHVPVRMSRAITPIADVISLLRMISVIRKFKPDIVHTHTPKAGLVGMLAAWICGVKIRIHTVAGLPLMEMKGWRRWLLVLAERLTYRCATRVLVNSFSLAEFIRQEIIGRKIDSKIGVLGNGSSNGIDTDWFSPAPEIIKVGIELRRSHDIPVDVPLFCFVGRLVRDKGIAELIAAFDEVRTTYNDAQLVLLGNFETERDPLDRKDVERIEQGNGIHAVGYCEDVRPWMAASDVFVFPSYREGFPNVVLQASAMEKAVIASDINGCNEIIEHGKTGWLVPVRDKRVLAETMRIALNDSPLTIEMGRSGRQRVVGRFSQTDFWMLLEAEYHRLSIQA